MDRYVLIFHGDGKRAELHDGLIGLIAGVRSGLWDGEPSQAEWEELVENILDPDNWEHDYGGPWSYHESFENDLMAIYRINEA